MSMTMTYFSMGWLDERLDIESKPILNERLKAHQARDTKGGREREIVDYYHRASRQSFWGLKSWISLMNLNWDESITNLYKGSKYYHDHIGRR